MSLPKNQQQILEFLKKCEVEDIVKTPVLYSMNKRGKIRVWQGFAAVVDASMEVEKSDKHGVWLDTAEFACASEYTDREELPGGYCGIIWTEYSQEGGKANVSQPQKVLRGNYIGKKNETTPFTLAVYKLRSKYEKNIMGGAVTDMDKVLDRRKVTFDKLLGRGGATPWRVNVMLLHDFKKHGKKIKFPCIAQEKIDGSHYTIVAHEKIRGGIDGFTRYKKAFGQEQILEAAKAVLSKYPGLYLSGELWAPGLKRNEASGKARLEGNRELQLWVFDSFYVDKKEPFSERWQRARAVVEEIASEWLHSVEWREIAKREELTKYFKEKVGEGAEGLVVRNLAAPYEFGITEYVRTMGALKLKEREDAEFRIVGFTEGTGGNEGLIIWIMETKKGKEFRANPVGLQEDRAKAFIEQSNKFTAKGKWATVEYDYINEDGMPIQPVFIRIRENK